MAGPSSKFSRAGEFGWGHWFGHSVAESIPHDLLLMTTKRPSHHDACIRGTCGHTSSIVKQPSPMRQVAACSRCARLRLGFCRARMMYLTSCRDANAMCSHSEYDSVS